ELVVAGAGVDVREDLARRPGPGVRVEAEGAGREGGRAEPGGVDDLGNRLHYMGAIAHDLRPQAVGAAAGRDGARDRRAVAADLLDDVTHRERCALEACPIHVATAVREGESREQP